MSLGRPALALDFLDGLDIPSERAFERSMLHAWLLREAGRLDEALALLRELVREHPAESLVHTQIAETLLLLGRAAEAHEAILNGRAALPGSAALSELEVRVVKALQGPPWERTIECPGEHFLVRSDGDKKLAREAARVLDEAWDRCESFFGPLATPPAEPSSAYLFAGEASYLSYVEGLADAGLENTRGVYATYLKQIAAWNQPSVAILWDTLRHECAHRYLELLHGLRIPRWLDEGLAEVFAGCWSPDGRWLPGGLRAERLAWFTSDHGGSGGDLLTSLETFLYLDEGRFLARVEQSYAQSWSLAHFLRFGDEPKRGILARLLAGLDRGEDPALAIDRAFEGVDLAELAKAYGSWLGEVLREDAER